MGHRGEGSRSPQEVIGDFALEEYDLDSVRSASVELARHDTDALLRRQNDYHRCRHKSRRRL